MEPRRNFVQRYPLLSWLLFSVGVPFGAMALASRWFGWPKPGIWLLLGTMWVVSLIQMADDELRRRLPLLLGCAGAAFLGEMAFDRRWSNDAKFALLLACAVCGTGAIMAAIRGRENRDVKDLFRRG